MAEFAGFTNNDAAPTDCCPVSREIADPDAVNILISVASIRGFVTQFVAISPRATEVKFAAVVEVADLKVYTSYMDVLIV